MTAGLWVLLLRLTSRRLWLPLPPCCVSFGPSKQRQKHLFLFSWWLDSNHGNRCGSICCLSVQSMSTFLWGCLSFSSPSSFICIWILWILQLLRLHFNPCIEWPQIRLHFLRLPSLYGWISILIENLYLILQDNELLVKGRNNIFVSLIIHSKYKLWGNNRLLGDSFIFDQFSWNPI